MKNKNIIKILIFLYFYFEGDEKKAEKWLYSSNPLLGGFSPSDMIKLGKEKKLLKFIINQIEENGGLNGKSTKNS